MIDSDNEIEVLRNSESFKEMSLSVENYYEQMNRS
jgi:hypothetical protein